MLAAEMSSMQRQHATIALMLRQEEGHVAETKAQLADLRERMGKVNPANTRETSRTYTPLSSASRAPMLLS